MPAQHNVRHQRSTESASSNAPAVHATTTFVERSSSKEFAKKADEQSLQYLIEQRARMRALRRKDGDENELFDEHKDEDGIGYEADRLNDSDVEDAGAGEKMVLWFTGFTVEHPVALLTFYFVALLLSLAFVGATGIVKR